MLKVESKIPIRNNSTPWSPNLAHTILDLYLWKVIISEVRLKINKREMLTNILSKLNTYSRYRKTSYIKCRDTKVINIHLKNAQKHLKHVKSKARQYCDEHLQVRECADEADSKDNHVHTRSFHNIIFIKH